jgi:hypothetical protein
MPDLTATASTVAARAVLGTRNADVNKPGSDTHMTDKEVNTWANHRAGNAYGVVREARKEN